MRPVRLARAAAEAEGLRLQRLVRRQVLRVVYAVVALIFLVAALGVGHVVGWMLLRARMTDLQALLALLGGDALLLVVFGLLAAVSHPGAVEREALEVRRAATSQLGRDVTAWVTLRPLVRILPVRHLYSLVLAGLTARNLSRR
ncbi:hypothetical protein [Acidisphaera rubrifaciens]|uniref:Uncharacterized protein n=1 Tax=Acidisphaera rubrifaciens HS-AP3 TaxID=1231350 RepID=A0A0D6P9C8_9PROT|nr:hypothetical protein [Acidisphaera rubrifaciens]GAN77966.1 hypothetical protein Asru_0547_03 [Acidisphaera rubrifaciens HS-AP3]